MPERGCEAPVPLIVDRAIDAQAVERLRTAGVDARLARIYAARGVVSVEIGRAHV